jgi:EmrB/QacA subfamily drug resistance transporter
MLAVALPELRRDFDVGHAEIGWLVSSYLIAMAVAQPLGGRLGDQLGRARVFRAGLLAFVVLSIAAAFAPTFALLVLLRTGQALVGAAVIPNGMGMLRESVPPSRLGQSAGFTGSAMSIAAAVGPLLGAVLLDAWSWRLLFLVNIPLVSAALFAQTLLPHMAAPKVRRLELDWPGALAFAALLTAVTFVFAVLGDGDRLLLIGGVVAVAVFGLAFLQRQRTSATPIAEWSLFRRRSYAAATAYVLLSNLVMYTTLLTIPFFVEELQGKGHGVVGLLLGAMSILMAIVSPLGGRFSDAYGRRLPAMIGAAIVTAAVVNLAFGLSEGSTAAYLMASLAVLGLGIGLSVGAASTAAIESAPVELAGIAAGTNSMMRYLGSIVGAGMLGAILSDDGGAPEIGLFQLIFAVLAALAVAAFVAALFIHRFVSETPSPTGDYEASGAEETGDGASEKGATRARGSSRARA